MSAADVSERHELRTMSGGQKTSGTRWLGAQRADYAMAAPGFLLGKARNARRLAAVAAAAVALSGASLAALPAAQAAAGTVAHGTAVRAHSPVGATPARVITCKIAVTLRFPHPLTATGRLRCSGQVRRITIDVQIFRNSRLVRSRAFTRSFVRSVAGTISAHCRSASYQAKVFGKVRLKSGRVLFGHARRTRQVRVSC
jgi:hypothetical protein